MHNHATAWQTDPMLGGVNDSLWLKVQRPWLAGAGQTIDSQDQCIAQVYKQFTVTRTLHTIYAIVLNDSASCSHIMPEKKLTDKNR